MLFQGGFLLVPTLLWHHRFPELGPWWVCALARADVQHCGLAASTDIQSWVWCLGGLDFQAAGRVLGALSWKSLFEHGCIFCNFSIPQINQNQILPASWDTSKHKGVLLWGHNYLCSLVFSFDQMTGTLGDPSIHGASKERESSQKAQEGAWYGSHRRKSWNLNPIHASPAPHRKRFTQPRRLRHMADPRRKQGQLSSQVPHPPSAPPCDDVTSCGHHGFLVPETILVHRLTGQGMFEIIRMHSKLF